MEDHYVYRILINKVYIAFCIAILFYPSQVGAILNPGTAYCSACGYDFVIVQTESGEMAMCKLPDGQEVEVHSFVAGTVATEWSYCAQQGYGVKHIESSELCDNCTVCILEDGSEVEVMELMNLNLNETKCGDGSCGAPENSETCPEDCPSGELDEYCDGVKDGKIDPDCEEGKDPDFVATAMSGDLDKDGDVDKDDLDILSIYLNKPASVKIDCDLDGDGMITALDSRKLSTMCTRHNCARQ